MFVFGLSYAPFRTPYEHQHTQYMSDKLSFQYIVDELSLKSGISRKQAEAFAKSFFDTLTDAFLNGEEMVRIKGLGTFKVVTVDSRESVNVSNGQRFLIPGYKKITFTPDDSAVDLLKQPASTPIIAFPHNTSADEYELQLSSSEAEQISSEAEQISSEAEQTSSEAEQISSEAEQISSEAEQTSSEAEQTSSETEISTAEDEDIASDTEELSVEDDVSEEEEFMARINSVDVDMQVEQAQDEFSAIDMLISTPESIDNVRLLAEEARAKAEAAIEEARKANAEMIRLQTLLSRLENNEMPEAYSHSEAGESAPIVVPAPLSSLADSSSLPSSSQLSSGDAPSDEPDSSLYLAESSSESCDASLSSAELSSESYASSLSSAESTSEDAPLSSSNADALDRVLSRHAEDEERPRRRVSGWAIFGYVTAASVLIGVIAYFLYGTFKSIEAVEHVAGVQTVKQQPVKLQSVKHPKPDKKKPVKQQHPVNPHKVSEADSLKSAPDSSRQSESAASSPTAVATQPKQTPSRPKTYVIKKGETLTLISRRFYGTKDSVRAIIRANTFANPDKVPVGTVIKLP